MSQQLRFHRIDPNRRRDYRERARIHEENSERHESENLRQQTRRFYRRINRTINKVIIEHPNLSPCEKAAFIDDQQLVNFDEIYDSDPDSPTQSPPPPEKDLDLINCPYSDQTSDNVFE